MPGRKADDGTTSYLTVRGMQASSLRAGWIWGPRASRRAAQQEIPTGIAYDGVVSKITGERDGTCAAPVVCVACPLPPLAAAPTLRWFLENVCTRCKLVQSESEPDIMQNNTGRGVPWFVRAAMAGWPPQRSQRVWIPRAWAPPRTRAAAVKSMHTSNAALPMVTALEQTLLLILLRNSLQRRCAQMLRGESGLRKLA